MNFAPLDFNNYGLLAFFFCFGLPIFLLGFSALTIHFVKVRKEKQGKDFSGDHYIVFVFAAAVVFAVGAAITFKVISFTSMGSNEKLATQNIMQKYDVKSIDWHGMQTTAAPVLDFDENHKGNELVVQANNGKNYVFIYEINHETSEPTLKDMPTPGGSNESVALSANDLLKNK